MVVRNDIKFGTDGWRAVIGDKFTFENVEYVSQAIADYIGKNNKAVVGYDTRFMSPAFAESVAAVLVGNNIDTVISKKCVPTPAVSYFIKKKKLAGGVVITASHNPGIYNGIKFKESFGGSALKDTTIKLEKLLFEHKVKKSKEPSMKTNITKIYINALKKYLKREIIKKKKFRIVVDSMYGAGGFLLEDILKGYGHDAITIHGERNPSFPGLHPEPIEENLKELSEKVRDYNADIGIATDGDADRVGIVDGDGKFITPHQVLSILFLHIKENRNWSGNIIKTISTTSLINKIAEKHGVQVRETPVGFKYIVEWMLKEDVLIGGEESGGNGFKNHIPERDGLLSGLLLVEMMCDRKKSVKNLIKDMEKEYGPYRYKRIDMHLEQKKIKKMYKKFKKNPPEKIAGFKIEDVKNYDGIKFILKDGSWLLLRGSGTEPLLRIYSEAGKISKVNKLLSAGKKIAQKM